MVMELLVLAGAACAGGGQLRVLPAIPRSQDPASLPRSGDATPTGRMSVATVVSLCLQHFMRPQESVAPWCTGSYVEDVVSLV